MDQTPVEAPPGLFDTTAKTIGSSREESSPRSPLDAAGDDVEKRTSKVLSAEESFSAPCGPPPPCSSEKVAKHASGRAIAGGEGAGGAPEGLRASHHELSQAKATRTVPVPTPSPRRSSSRRPAPSSLFQPPQYSSSPVPPPSCEAYYAYASSGAAAQQYYQQQQGFYHGATMQASASLVFDDDGIIVSPSHYYRNYHHQAAAAYSCPPCAWMGAYDVGAVPGGVTTSVTAGAEEGERAEKA